ncbi:MAG: hypothetical protein HOG49_34770 [Candidatus Scalindua sp.]|jgi:hypothetical protein|nr:hypothetical protein [Candidatus Scalindua sp.]
MKYIKDEKLAELLDGKRVAFVAPGAHLVGTGQGKKIDDYDIVIRAGQVFPIDGRLKRDVGERTDILLHSFNIIGISTANNNREFIESMKYIICAMVGGGFVMLQNEFLGRYRRLGIGTHKVDEEYMKSFFEEIGSRANSGYVGINVLLKYNIKELFLTGFSFYNMGEYGTTYNSQYLANAIKEGSITSNRMHPITGVDDGHDQKKQITHFKYLLKNNKNIKLDYYLKRNFK